MRYLAMLTIVVAGCSAAPQKTEVIEVDKPVAINCIKEKPARPLYRTEHLGPQATDLEYADALRNDWPLSRIYEKTMEDAVTACLVK